MTGKINIAFPLRFDALGRTARTGDAEHIREMIVQLLLTRPGERVNRPEFGSGLMQAVLAINSPEIATALQFTTRAALQSYLGDIIEIESFEFRADEAVLRVDLTYSMRTTGDRRSESILLSIAA